MLKKIEVDTLFVAKNSSNIDKIAIVGQDLVVQFMNGAIYQYKDGAGKFDLLTKAESVGKALNQAKVGLEFQKLDVEAIIEKVNKNKEMEKANETAQKNNS